MSEQTSGQFVTGPTQKTFHPYNHQPKAFQTYSQIQANNPFSGQAKEVKTKIEESETKRGYNSGPLGSGSINGTASNT